MLNRSNMHHIEAAAKLILDYHESLPALPVKPSVEPGFVSGQLPLQAPESGCTAEELLADTASCIVPNLTHWQHPGFMAWFPSNTSFPSLLGEFIAAGLGINAMMWDTSPAAAELEQRVLEWLRDMCCLPGHWQGVIQDTASTGTLTALIAARETALKGAGNELGLFAQKPLVVYTSNQAHYSIEKGARAAGFGSALVRKIDCDHQYAMKPEALEKAILEDLANGLTPCAVVATLGTTSTLAFDPLATIGTICQKYKVWLHVDAAYAGNAFLLPEYRSYTRGLEYADSYVFNPHKWLFTHFDCSILFVNNPLHLIRTFSHDPDYLKATLSDSDIRNYKDWGLPLGRRFRALKIWYVIRYYGNKGLQEKLREHIRLAEMIRDNIQRNKHLQLVAPPSMNVLVVRYVPHRDTTPEELDKLNRKWLNLLISEGSFFLSGTLLDQVFAIRIVPAQSDINESIVYDFINLLERTTQQLNSQTDV